MYFFEKFSLVILLVDSDEKVTGGRLELSLNSLFSSNNHNLLITACLKNKIIKMYKKSNSIIVNHKLSCLFKNKHLQFYLSSLKIYHFSSLRISKLMLIGVF